MLDDFMIPYKNKKYLNTVDEMFGKSKLSMKPKRHCSEYWKWFMSQSDCDLKNARYDAELLFKKFGITFSVYGDDADGFATNKFDRVIPFDLIPRIISADEWKILEKGLIQRVKALNHFLHDVYHNGRIFAANVVPSDLIYGNSQYRYQMQNVSIPNKIYAQICGVDLVRTNNNDFYVLEDNLRVPSGVSYMIENRKVMMRLFPEIFERSTVSPIEHYPDLLLRHLKSSAKILSEDPCVVLLTPGTYNSAYFEHAYLAQKMGVELVEGRDLFVKDCKVFMKTTAGSIRVDVIYRRIDDDFMDPLFFRSESFLGVPGLLTVVREGGVTICNSFGTGIADDKSVYIVILK